MIRFPDGTLFDDDAANAAYDRAQRRGVVKHYAPGLDAAPARRLPMSLAEHLKPKPAAGLAGLIFGRARGR